MSADFSQAVRNALASGCSLEEGVALLGEYKEKGVTREQVRAWLQELRAEADESSEDKILELLDVVTGFCAPRLRVWE